MIAPIVPNGLSGIGMKKGKLAGTLYRTAWKKCPSSCVVRMNITGTAKATPPAR
jgi:hypothetical protein